MNPFDLKGPEFLLFYITLCLATVVLLRLFYRFREAGETSSALKLTDPYQMAFLRNGRHEAVRIATVSLIDRGLLKAKADKLVVTRADAGQFAQRPIEQAIIGAFHRSASAYKVMTSGGSLAIDEACDQYKIELQKLGLLPDAAVFASRLVPFLVSLAIIGGFAGIKIHVALSRGKHNIAFLIMLLAFFIWVAFAAFVKRRTRLGDVVLKNLKNHFTQLKSRAAQIKPRGSTNELALLAALWGLSVLPSPQFPYIRELYPKAASSSGSTWSGGCGDGGSSGGGGCGGGGCGGGCGGCGG